MMLYIVAYISCCMLTVIQALCNMPQRCECLVLLALCFTCASANDALQMENGCMSNNHSCVSHRLTTMLGSSVLLPCNFTKKKQNLTVSWIHSPAITVLTIASGGKVNFSDPRFGRINMFPNQGSKGNYSISINNVNDTDLGCYRCLNQDNCVEVELALKTESNSWVPFYTYVISGVAAIIVLAVGCFLCVNYLLKGNKETEENPIITLHDANDGSNTPAQETRKPGDGQPQDKHQPSSPTYVNSIVYENDHDEDEPDYLNEIPGPSGTNRNNSSHTGHFNFERGESQRTKQSFHTELINRLRQASLRKHYYVNQNELHKPQNTRLTKGSKKKKPKAYRQFPNPIYNRSTDGLDQM